MKQFSKKQTMYAWLALFLVSAILLSGMEAIGLALFFTLPSTEVTITLKANEIGLLLFGVFGRSTFTGFWLYYSWLQYRKAKVASYAETGEPNIKQGAV